MEMEVLVELQMMKPMVGAATETTMTATTTMKKKTWTEKSNSNNGNGRRRHRRRQWRKAKRPSALARREKMSANMPSPTAARRRHRRQAPAEADTRSTVTTTIVRRQQHRGRPAASVRRVGPAHRRARAGAATPSHREKENERIVHEPGAGGTSPARQSSRVRAHSTETSTRGKCRRRLGAATTSAPKRKTKI